jgi:hypothetical protein
MNLGQRLPENPILTARDVRPSSPELEVVSVFNAAAAVVGDEVILLLRVAERPRTDVRPGPDALTLDFDQPHPLLHPLPSRFREQELVGMCFLDTRQTPPRTVVAYIPADLPGSTSAIRAPSATATAPATCGWSTTATSTSLRRSATCALPAAATASTLPSTRARRSRR